MIISWSQALPYYHGALAFSRNLNWLFCFFIFKVCISVSSLVLTCCSSTSFASIYLFAEGDSSDSMAKSISLFNWARKKPTSIPSSSKPSNVLSQTAKSSRGVEISQALIFSAIWTVFKIIPAANRALMLLRRWLWRYDFWEWQSL